MIKIIKATILFFVLLIIKSTGLANKEIQSILNPYVPIIETILKISNWFEKLEAIRFHGKPVRIDPLINSKIPKIREKIRNDLMIFCDLKIKKKVSN